MDLKVSWEVFRVLEEHKMPFEIRWWLMHYSDL